MKNFYLPDSENLNKINTAFVKYVYCNPEVLKENIKIKGMYGAPGSCVWNGGRLVLEKSLQYWQIQDKIEFYNNKDILYRYTFTNECVQENDVYDLYCNMLMKAGNNGKNQFLINSKILEKYLRLNYPKYGVVSSTTKCERNLKVINEDIKKYDMVVLDFRDNRNYDFLSLLEDKDKIEILVDAWCDVNCQNRNKCYKNLSKAQRTWNYERYNHNCNNILYSFYDILNSNKIERNVLTNSEIDSLYLMGFKHFKLEGRTNSPVDVLSSYIYYLINDNYKDKIYNDILFNIGLK